MRIPFVALALVGAISFPSGAAAVVGETPASQQIIVREVSAVTNNLVRLGDLFVNVGEKADLEVGYAPAPGKRMVFDARMLYRVARAHGLDWRPLSNHDRAVIERESVIVTGNEIESRILAALGEKGVDADGVVIELNNPMLKLHLPADAVETVEVDNLDYSASSQRVSAILAVPGDGLTTRRVRVAGRLHRVSSVPVLARRVMRGEIISARDIEWQEQRSSRIPHNTILDAEALVGLSPKRTLRAGTPIRNSEVQQPVVVPKGGLVTLVLTTDSMVLTARGRALEDGSHGDAIRVTNDRSHTVIEGVVTRAGTVAVSPSGVAAIN